MNNNKDTRPNIDENLEGIRLAYFITRIISFYKNSSVEEQLNGVLEDKILDEFKGTVYYPNTQKEKDILRNLALLSGIECKLLPNGDRYWRLF